MNLAKSLSERLKEVLTEGTWVTGTNFKAQIINLEWQDAIKKIEDLNSVADLTFHINYYVAGVTKVLKGGPLEIKDKFSFDYPPIESAEDWKNLSHKFCADAENFIQLVEQLEEAKLLGNFVDEKYGTYYRNIDVMIEHTYYHLGQVILIKKLIQNK